ncbi:MAG: MBL fold metallo-hydrolase [Myxococcales bacterium]|nr:MBL fold metallo-hydrolase [Myxococcales bacterium]
MSSNVTTIDTHYTGRPLIAASYLLRTDDAVAFVETGTTPTLPHLLQALTDAGLTPADVTHVVITHVHLDHAGGAGALMQACPGATLWAHPRAAPHAIDPSRLIHSAKAVYGEAFSQLYGEILPIPEERVVVANDGDTLDLGGRTLTFLHTRGHANHHFCVQDSGSDGIFTGDSFGIVYPSLQRKGLFAFPSTTPTDFDAEAAHQSVDRIVATGCSVAYPTHFGPQHAIVAIADQLHRQLERYGALVEQGDESGLEEAALDAWCRTAVDTIFDEELTRAGLGDDAEARTQCTFDADINAQGIAFAIRKRRYKRSQVP